jgi:hypothetical protein
MVFNAVRHSTAFPKRMVVLQKKNPDAMDVHARNVYVIKMNFAAKNYGVLPAFSHVLQNVVENAGAFLSVILKRLRAFLLSKNAGMTGAEDLAANVLRENIAIHMVPALTVPEILADHA